MRGTHSARQETRSHSVKTAGSVSDPFKACGEANDANQHATAEQQPYPCTGKDPAVVDYKRCADAAQGRAVDNAA